MGSHIPLGNMLGGTEDLELEKLRFKSQIYPLVGVGLAQMIEPL